MSTNTGHITVPQNIFVFPATLATKVIGFQKLNLCVPWLMRRSRVPFTRSVYTSATVFTAVDGVWTDWNHWSQCDVTCGTGTSTRIRSCTNPPPAHGGNGCQGPSVETSACMLSQCPGKIRVFKFAWKSSINVFVNHEEPIETPPYFVIIFILSI